MADTPASDDMLDAVAHSGPNKLGVALEQRLQRQQLLLSQGAHEIRNQLAVILLQLGKLQATGAREVEAQVRTLSETVDRLGLLARLAAGADTALIDVDLSAVVRQAVNRVEVGTAKACVRIDEVEDKMHACKGHRGYLGEAVYCLLDNAVRHGNDGTQIVVAVGEGPVIVVDDDGPGFPQGMIDQLTAPFATGRGTRAGAGLGLAIAHEVARLHRGELVLARSHLGGAQASLRLAVARLVD